MKATIKGVSDIYGSLDAVIKVGKREVKTNVGDLLETLLQDVKRVEFSDKRFSGSTEYEVSHAPGRDGFHIENGDQDVWVCAEGLRRVGLKGSKLKKVYVKIRR